MYIIYRYTIHIIYVYIYIYISMYICTYVLFLRLVLMSGHIFAERPVPQSALVPAPFFGVPCRQHVLRCPRHLRPEGKSLPIESKVPKHLVFRVSVLGIVVVVLGRYLGWSLDT